MSDLHELSALQIGAAIAERTVSPLEVVEHFLRRIDADPVGAFVLVEPERHLADARVLTRRRPEGASPLWGVPVSVKDLEPVAGQRTSFGSAAFRNYVPPASSAVVTRLQRAGLIALGKTTTPEFGLVCYSEPDDHPGARSPWNTRFSASGSSGGAAASVAAGLVPLAQGGDGGGSIRTPAAACGVVGIKPSRGRVSSDSASADVIGLSTLGPLARSVEDAAALLDVLVGTEPGDNDARPYPGSWLEAARRPPGPLRVGWYTSLPHGDQADEACQDAVTAAVQRLTDLGHQVEPIANPEPADFASTLPRYGWSRQRRCGCRTVPRSSCDRSPGFSATRAAARAALRRCGH